MGFEGGRGMLKKMASRVGGRQNTLDKKRGSPKKFFEVLQ